MSNTCTVQIKCGNCKSYHDSVAAVKACFQGAEVSTVTQAVQERQRSYNEIPASEKQKNFIRTLMGERGFDASTADAVLANLKMGDASEKIKTLLATPKTTQVKETVTMAKVPSGRYALVLDGVTKFFKVDTPTEGQWAGRTFLKVQASDELYPVKATDLKAKVLGLIAADPEAASKRYGHELGQCGVCGRTLTDETSRANGIGPICAGKMGW